ncbi:MAG TPA: hypothetical protein VLC09_03890 [Polyangiaceae bacterium]|nr:hypothetical protein [Polyangiaceae bacterium]
MLGSVLPDLNARLAALQSFSPVSGSLADSIALAQATLNNLNLALSLGVAVPSLDFQIAEVAAQIAAIEAQIALAAGLANALAAVGVHAYHYAGTVASMGSAIAAEVGSGFPGGTGADSCNALIFATSIPSVWTAMQAVFKTTP